MTEINKLLNRYQQFYNEYFVDTPELYQQLVKEGQSPKTLIIACSDSRVDPSILFKSEPGELFVIRNVANLVPPFESDFSHCHGTSAAIEYAVRHLKVENIIVLGHSHCGGIKTLVDKHNHQHNFIDAWLSIADTVAQNNCDSGNRYCTCEKEAIKLSVDNLKTFPFIYDAVLNQNLQLCGWYFCIENGTLEEICRLNADNIA